MPSGITHYLGLFKLLLLDALPTCEASTETRPDFSNALARTATPRFNSVAGQPAKPSINAPGCGCRSVKSDNAATSKPSERARSASSLSFCPFFSNPVSACPRLLQLRPAAPRTSHVRRPTAPSSCAHTSDACAGRGGQSGLPE